MATVTLTLDGIAGCGKDARAAAVSFLEILSCMAEAQFVVTMEGVDESESVTLGCKEISAACADMGF